MPRRNRCVLPGVACHVTQRGVDRREVFSSREDRTTYLRLLRDNLVDAEAAILGYCLMTNHVHLIAVPGREDSLAILFRRVHGRYAQYYNTLHGRTGHFWQNRYFACVLDERHLWRALAYVERNPVRAGLVDRAVDYGWSSAGAHVSGNDAAGVLDMAWWRREGEGAAWSLSLADGEEESASALRRCTYSGKPFGEEAFVKEMSVRFGRSWTRGRPKKEQPAMRTAAAGQQAMFEIMG